MVRNRETGDSIPRFPFVGGFLGPGFVPLRSLCTFARTYGKLSTVKTLLVIDICNKRRVVQNPRESHRDITSH